MKFRQFGKIIEISIEKIIEIKETSENSCVIYFFDPKGIKTQETFFISKKEIESKIGQYVIKSKTKSSPKNDDYANCLSCYARIPKVSHTCPVCNTSPVPWEQKDIVLSSLNSFIPTADAHCSHCLQGYCIEIPSFNEGSTYSCPHCDNYDEFYFVADCKQCQNKNAFFFESNSDVAMEVGKSMVKGAIMGAKLVSNPTNIFNGIAIGQTVKPFLDKVSDGRIGVCSICSIKYVQCPYCRTMREFSHFNGQSPLVCYNCNNQFRKI